VPSKRSSTLSPSAHTSVALLPDTRASVRVVGLAIALHVDPFERRMRPFSPTANMADPTYRDIYPHYFHYLLQTYIQNPD
jgi:hypothetical protein